MRMRRGASASMLWKIKARNNSLSIKLGSTELSLVKMVIAVGVFQRACESRTYKAPREEPKPDGKPGSS